MKINYQHQYKKQSLSDNELGIQPANAFKIWLDEAKQHSEHYSAFNLSTSAKNGRVSSRIVLLKEIENESLIFFSDYTSLKGEQIAENPLVAVTFFWGELERQVRIEGKISKISTEKSDHYFNSRPEASQWAAIASEQSKIVVSRENLEEIYEKIKRTEKNERPANWGGYSIDPHYYEFWQGRENRLNDRIAFEKAANGWKRYRLQP